MESSPSRRSTMSDKLHSIADPLGIEVYFQPPENVKMKFPCIVYELRDIQKRSADNGPYSMFDQYDVTFIRHEPDSPVIHELMGLPHSSFSRRFATSGLNHDVFVIYN